MWQKSARAIVDSGCRSLLASEGNLAGTRPLPRPLSDFDRSKTLGTELNPAEAERGDISPFPQLPPVHGEGRGRGGKGARGLGSKPADK